MPDKSDDGDHEGASEVISEIEQRLIKDKLSEKDELREASGVAGDKPKGQGSALHKIITISDDVKQLLAMANFRDPEEAENAVGAIVEAQRYGLSLDMILFWVSAHCGVVSQGKSKTEWGVQALTHLELSQAQSKFSFKPKKEEKVQ